MANALNIARYLVKLADADERPEQLTQLRLHKLLYYVQGWSLASGRGPMFPERIQAWRRGPVVKDLYAEFRDLGRASINPEQVSQPDGLSEDDKAFIRSVWEAHKRYTAGQLVNKTHEEDPWKLTWGDRREDASSREEITPDRLSSFFERVRQESEVPGLEFDRIKQAERDLEEGRGVPFKSVMAKLNDAI